MEYAEKINNTAQSLQDSITNNFSLFESVLDELWEADSEIGVDEEVGEFIAQEDETSIAQAIAAAKKISAISEGNEVTTFMEYKIASEASNAATFVKGAIDYANGDIDLQEFTDKVVDTAECRLVASLDTCIDVGIELVGPAIAVAFPPLEPVIPVVHNILRTLKPEIKKTVHSVVHSLGEFAKKAVPVLVDKVKAGAKQMLSSLF